MGLYALVLSVSKLLQREGLTPLLGESTRLSIVIPVYNEEQWIANSYQALVESIRKSRISIVEIIVVDDGSTDATASVADALTSEFPTRVVHIENSGRLMARMHGLALCNFENVLLLDSRVLIAIDSLEFLAGALRDCSGRSCWVAHVHINLDGDPFNRFWSVITRAAWGGYLRNPRAVRFGADEYDAYPKGTTCFLGPTHDLLELHRDFTGIVGDLSLANDDTAILRRLIALYDFNIDPRFSCTYFGRKASVSRFVRHTVHRGTVFVDGHLLEPNRYRTFLWIFLMASVIAVPVFVLLPKLAVTILATTWAAAFICATVVSRDLQTGSTFALILPLFSLMYAIGIWRGALLVLAQRIGVRANKT